MTSPQDPSLLPDGSASGQPGPVAQPSRYGHRRTAGRRVVGISVVRERDGSHLDALAGIGRAVLHVLDSLPLGSGDLWPLWDRKEQTFADELTSPVVVRL